MISLKFPFLSFPKGLEVHLRVCKFLLDRFDVVENKRIVRSYELDRRSQTAV